MMINYIAQYHQSFIYYINNTQNIFYLSYSVYFEQSKLSVLDLFEIMPVLQTEKRFNEWMDVVFGSLEIL